MSILTANLKHYYQRRMYWLIWPLIIAFSGMAIGGLIGGKHFFLSGPVATMLMLGLVLAMAQIETLAKPHMFCMPGHRAVARKLLLSAGIITLIILLTAHLIACRLSVTGNVVSLIAVFSLYWLTYLLGIFFAYATRNIGLIGLFYLPVIGEQFINLNNFVLHQIPYVIIVSAIIMTIYSWRYLGNDNTVREICGKIVSGFNFDPAKLAKIKQYNENNRLRKGKSVLFQISRPVEYFFIAMLKAAPEGSRAKYIWGGLYRSPLAIHLSQLSNIRPWIVMVIMTAWLGYCSPAINIIFLMPVLFAMNVDLGINTKLLVAGSRQDRFSSALTLALLWFILGTICAIMLWGLSCLLAEFLPEFPTQNFGMISYHAANIKFLPLIALTPLAFTINLLCKNKFLAIMIALALVCGLQGYFVAQGFRKSEQMTNVSNFLLLITMAIGLISWLAFIVALKRVCTKGQLVR